VHFEVFAGITIGYLRGFFARLAYDNLAIIAPRGRRAAGRRVEAAR